MDDGGYVAVPIEAGGDWEVNMSLRVGTSDCERVRNSVEPICIP